MAPKAQVAAKPAAGKPQGRGSMGIPVDDQDDEEVAAEGLPPGIESLKMWGRTKITWGKAAKNSTYAQVVEAAAAKRDPLAGYAKWVLAQSRPNHPGLRDLQLYLRLRKAEFMPRSSHELFFPGSRVPRVLADDNEEDGSDKNVDEGL
jgi:hypothetical protein